MRQLWVSCSPLYHSLQKALSDLETQGLSGVKRYMSLALYLMHTSAAARRDVASCGRIIWEGYMGAQEPAFLMRSTVNLEQTGSPRHEHLSTGLYTLMDVVCSGCHSLMGWQYLQASHEVSSQTCRQSIQFQHAYIVPLARATEAVRPVVHLTKCAPEAKCSMSHEHLHLHALCSHIQDCL